MGITRHVHDHILRRIPEASLAVGRSHDSADHLGAVAKAAAFFCIYRRDSGKMIPI